MRGREGDDFPLAGPWDCEFSSGFAALFEQLLCAGMGVLSTFDLKSMVRGSLFVHRHGGFKQFRYDVTQLLCTGMGVLRTFGRFGATFVHRHGGFKHFWSIW